MDRDQLDRLRGEHAARQAIAAGLEVAWIEAIAALARARRALVAAEVEAAIEAEQSA